MGFFVFYTTPNTMNPENLQKKLGDKDLPVSLGDHEIDKTPIKLPVRKDSINFSLGVEGKCDVSLFNDANDFDAEKPDEVLGKSGSLVEFAPGSAWLKYSASVGIKTDSGLEVERFGFSFGGNAAVSTAIYRKHKPDETVLAATTSDAAPLITIFSPNRIKDLSPGEAVTFSFQGELQASVKVTWSDIFSTNLSAITELLNKNELFKLSIGAEASAGFSVSVKDNYSVKIICKKKDTFGLYIAKTKSRSAAGSIGAKVGAEFENKDEIQTVLTAIVEGYFKQGEEKIKQIIAKAEDELNKSDNEIIRMIADRLGWDNEKSLLKKLKDEYNSIQKKLTTKIEELAKLKVSASFSYDYSRINSSSTLLEAETNADGIRQFHTEILKLDVRPLIASIQGKEKILKGAKLLKKDVETISRVSGFSIGFGNWKAFSTKKEKIEESRVENEDGFRQISFMGMRSYTDRAGADGAEWKIDLNAQMPSFSQRKVPFANEFDYSLYLNLTTVEKKVTLQEAARFTDLAAIWGIIPEGDVETEAKDLADKVAKSQNITLTCEFKVSPNALEPMLPVLARTAKNQKLIALALGKAMPRWSDHALRRNITDRAQVYGELWNAYLNDKDIPSVAQIYADAAFRLLQKKEAALAKAERDFSKGPFQPEAFGSIINNNPGTFTSVERLAASLKNLADGNDLKSTAQYDPLIPKSFDGVEDFWRHRHHFRMLGVLLAMVADASPLLKQHIERTATVSYKDSKGKEMVYLISKA
jgi:hypothetical protein